MSSSEINGRKSVTCVLGVVLVAASFALSGYFIRDGLMSFRTADRVVSVKGLAEKEVAADLAVWTLSYTATGNDLVTVQAQIDASTEKVRAFLNLVSFVPDEIDQKPLQVQDLLAQSYRPDGVEKGRYIITQNIVIRTTQISRLDNALAKLGDLLRQGVALSNTQPPMYFFTKLNDIKPEMLAQATKNARDAASEFAAQSGANVGGIKSASQGIFQILPRDPIQYESEQNQKNKLVRVVSTLEFYLK